MDACVPCICFAKMSHTVLLQASFPRNFCRGTLLLKLVRALQDSFLGDLVNEISMQNAATEATYAQAQATAAVQLQVSKDQFIRLTADFDNFRRRTVGTPHTVRLPADTCACLFCMHLQCLSGCSLHALQHESKRNMLCC